MPPGGGGGVTGAMGRVIKGGGTGGQQQKAAGQQQKGARVLATRYALSDEIGRGASGVVFKALDMQTGGMVAIKEVAIRGESKDQMQLLQREIDLLKLLKNPYIVEYRESFNTRDTLFIVMEFVENGSLSLIVKKFGRLQESLVIIYMLQILEGLSFLHDQGVIHRDIKGANILISTGGQVKLADFGVATKLEAAGLDTQANSVVGTPYWMAPEIIQMSGFTTASDIWSVGCTVIELISGAPPFFELAPMSALFRIVHENCPPLPPDISPRLTDFLMQCFKKDTAVRPTARKLRGHIWLTGPEPDGAARGHASMHATCVTSEASEQADWTRSDVVTMTGGQVPEHLLPHADTIRRIEGLRTASIMPDTKVSTIGWDRPPRFSSMDDVGRAHTICTSTPPSFPPPPPPAAHVEPETINTSATNESIVSGLSASDTRPAAPPPPPPHHAEAEAADAIELTQVRAIAQALARDECAPPDEPSPPPAPSPPPTARPTPREPLRAALSRDAAGSWRDSSHPTPRTDSLRESFLPRDSLGGGWHAYPPSSHKEATGTMFASGTGAAALRLYAERGVDADSFDSLLGGGEPPDFAKAVQWRLHTPWAVRLTGGHDTENMLEYIDPFENIPPVAANQASAEADAELVRRQLRSHISKFQRGSEGKEEHLMLEAVDKLLAVLSPEPSAPPTSSRGRPLNDPAADFVSEHGMLPVVAELQITSSTKIISRLLQLVNTVVGRGGAGVCETACMLGVIPAVIPYVETQYPQNTRLEAARFSHAMCTTSHPTQQMFVACQGLPALVRLLLNPATGHELVILAIDSIKAVLDMRGRSPRNDLCRTLVELELLELLVGAIHEVNAKYPLHAERSAGIFLLFSLADTEVKARMATRKVLPGLMQVLARPDEFAPGLILKVLRTIKNLCMGEAAHMDELQRAQAIPHLIALLRLKRGGAMYAEMRNQCVNALYLLCRINRSRQEAAAINGALPILQEIIAQGSPLRQFALPIVCDIAKASKRSRAELKQHNGVQFYLGLLSTEYWQEAALDSLLVWLLDEPSHVAKFMATSQGVQQLQVVMEAANNQSFAQMLSPLDKIISSSPLVNRALGKIDDALGHSPFVRALVARLQHPDALVRKVLLNMLTYIYTKHQSPKQLVELHQLEPVLRALKNDDPSILVRRLATELHDAFATHDIL